MNTQQQIGSMQFATTCMSSLPLLTSTLAAPADLVLPSFGVLDELVDESSGIEVSIQWHFLRDVSMFDG